MFYELTQLSTYHRCSSCRIPQLPISFITTESISKVILLVIMIQNAIFNESRIHIICVIQSADQRHISQSTYRPCLSTTIDLHPVPVSKFHSMSPSTRYTFRKIFSKNILPKNAKFSKKFLPSWKVSYWDREHIINISLYNIIAITIQQTYPLLYCEWIGSCKVLNSSSDGSPL